MDDKICANCQAETDDYEVCKICGNALCEECSTSADTCDYCISLESYSVPTVDGDDYFE